MELLWGIAAVAAVALAARWLFGRSGGAGRPGCGSCRHCRKLFDDGTLCGFGRREVFKNEVHVRNCTDYERRVS